MYMLKLEIILQIYLWIQSLYLKLHSFFIQDKSIYQSIQEVKIYNTYIYDSRVVFSSNAFYWYLSIVYNRFLSLFINNSSKMYSFLSLKSTDHYTIPCDVLFELEKFTDFHYIQILTRDNKRYMFKHENYDWLS